MNCCVCPGIKVAGFGKIAMDVMLGTVSATGGLVTEPELAVMLVVPGETPVATPAESIVATPVLEEAQVTLVGGGSVSLPSL
jgi:hypothetical protein